MMTIQLLTIWFAMIIGVTESLVWPLPPPNLAPYPLHVRYDITACPQYNFTCYQDKLNQVVVESRVLMRKWDTVPELGEYCTMFMDSQTCLQETGQEPECNGTIPSRIFNKNEVYFYRELCTADAKEYWLAQGCLSHRLIRHHAHICMDAMVRHGFMPDREKEQTNEEFCMALQNSLMCIWYTYEDRCTVHIANFSHQLRKHSLQDVISNYNCTVTIDARDTLNLGMGIMFGFAFLVMLSIRFLWCPKRCRECAGYPSEKQEDAAIMEDAAAKWQNAWWWFIKCHEGFIGQSTLPQISISYSSVAKWVLTYQFKHGYIDGHFEYRYISNFHAGDHGEFFLIII